MRAGAASTATLPRPDPPRGQISQTAAAARAACRVPLPPQRHGNGRPESQVTADGTTRQEHQTPPHGDHHARTYKADAATPLPCRGRGMAEGSGRAGGRWLVSRAGDFSHPYGPTCASILRLLGALLGARGLDAEPEAELIASSRVVVTTHLSGGCTLDGNVDATATTRLHTRRVSTHGSPNRGLINDPTISFQC